MYLPLAAAILGINLIFPAQAMQEKSLKRQLSWQDLTSIDKKQKIESQKPECFIFKTLQDNNQAIIPFNLAMKSEYIENFYTDTGYTEIIINLTAPTVNKLFQFVDIYCNEKESTKDAKLNNLLENTPYLDICKIPELSNILNFAYELTISEFPFAPCIDYFINNFLIDFEKDIEVTSISDNAFNTINLYCKSVFLDPIYKLALEKLNNFNQPSIESNNSAPLLPEYFKFVS